MVVVEYDDDVCAMNMKIYEANAYMSDCEALRGSLQQKINELKEELASL